MVEKETYVGNQLVGFRQNPEIPTSVVVSMYNVRQEIFQMIEGLFIPGVLHNLSTATQLVIIDDGSPLRHETSAMMDKYLGVFRHLAGDVVYKRFEANSGFAGAYNKGITRADGQVIVMVNDDVYLPKDSVAALVESATMDQTVGVVGPVIDATWTLQGTRLFRRIEDYSPKQIEKIEQFSLWLRRVMAGQRYVLQGSRTFLTGSCLTFQADVFHGVGPFDERFIYGLFEDVDWSRRVREAGYDLVVDAATFVEHGGTTRASHSLRQDRIKRTKAMIVNAIAYGRKWGCLHTVLIDLAHGMLQSYGMMSIDGEIIKTAQALGLWEEYRALRNE